MRYSILGHQYRTHEVETMSGETKLAKVVPVVVRSNGADVEILAFEHPLAGHQIVKGTRILGEPFVDACVRELREESGLISIPSRALGSIHHTTDQIEWHFYLMEVISVVPEHFSYFAEDDGGHVFRFFWHRLSDELTTHWHPRYHEPIGFLKSALLI